jgi:hypothetical protein
MIFTITFATNTIYLTHQMRVFTFLFAVYILGITLMPCCDAVTCPEESPTELSANHNHSEDEEDHCTPFCTCTCCGSIFTSTAIPAVITFNTTPTFISHTVYYKLSTPKDYNAGVWHPPALS